MFRIPKHILKFLGLIHENFVRFFSKSTNLLIVTVFFYSECIRTFAAIQFSEQWNLINLYINNKTHHYILITILIVLNDLRFWVMKTIPSYKDSIGYIYDYNKKTVFFGNHILFEIKSTLHIYRVNNLHCNFFQIQKIQISIALFASLT